MRGLGRKPVREGNAQSRNPRSQSQGGPGRATAGARVGIADSTSPRELAQDEVIRLPAARIAEATLVQIVNAAVDEGRSRVAPFGEVVTPRSDLESTWFVERQLHV